MLPEQTELQAGRVVVMGPDDLMVTVARWSCYINVHTRTMCCWALTLFHLFSLSQWSHSSLSRPFGSRLITRSGVLLNSLVLDFSWPNKTRGHFQTNPVHKPLEMSPNQVCHLQSIDLNIPICFSFMPQRNEVQPGKRPLSFLMPTIVVPAWNKCGIYMALSSSGGQESLSAITQVWPCCIKKIFDDIWMEFQCKTVTI